MFSVSRKVNIRLSATQHSVVEITPREWGFINRLHTEPEKAVMEIVPYIATTKSRNIDLIAAAVKFGSTDQIKILSKIVPLRTLFSISNSGFRKLLDVCGPVFTTSIKEARLETINDALVMIYKLSLVNEFDLTHVIYANMQSQMRDGLPLLHDTANADIELFDGILVALQFVSICEATGKMTETMGVIADMYRHKLEGMLTDDTSDLGKMLAAYASAYLKPNVEMLLTKYVNIKPIMVTLMYNRLTKSTRSSSSGCREIGMIMGEIFLNLAQAWGCGMTDGIAVCFLARLNKREMTEMVKYIINSRSTLAEDAIDTMLNHAENLLDDTQPFLIIVAAKEGSSRAIECIVKKLIMSHEVMNRQVTSRADMAFHVHLTNLIMTNASNQIPFGTRDSAKPNADQLKPKLFLMQLMDELAAKHNGSSDTESDGEVSDTEPSDSASQPLDEAMYFNLYAILYVFLLYMQNKDDFIAKADIVAADSKMDLGSIQTTFATLTANVKKMATVLFDRHGVGMSTQTQLAYHCILDIGKTSPSVNRLADLVFQSIKRGETEVTFAPICMMNDSLIAKETLSIIQYALMPKGTWLKISQENLIGIYGADKVRVVAESGIANAHNLRLFGSTEKDIESFARDFITPLLRKCQP